MLIVKKDLEGDAYEEYQKDYYRNDGHDASGRLQQETAR